MPYFPPPWSDELPPDIVAALIGWARVPPALGWRRPGLPREWCPVLECDPGEPKRAPLAGWVYIYESGRVREVDSRILEIVKGPVKPLS
jgi:hypothetical protein